MQFINVPMTSLMRGILRKKASLDFPSIRYFSPFHSIFVLFLPCYNGQLSLAPTITSMNAWQLKILSLSLSLARYNPFFPSESSTACHLGRVDGSLAHRRKQRVFVPKFRARSPVTSLTHRARGVASQLDRRTSKERQGPPERGNPRKEPAPLRTGFFRNGGLFRRPPHYSGRSRVEKNPSIPAFASIPILSFVLPPGGIEARIESLRGEYIVKSWHSIAMNLPQTVSQRSHWVPRGPRTLYYLLSSR